jgi:hypothetical protein
VVPTDTVVRGAPAQPPIASHASLQYSTPITFQRHQLFKNAANIPSCRCDAHVAPTRVAWAQLRCRVNQRPGPRMRPGNAISEQCPVPGYIALCPSQLLHGMRAAAQPAAAAPPHALHPIQLPRLAICCRGSPANAFAGRVPPHSACKLGAGHMLPMNPAYAASRMNE